jgi:BirA family biotin operon repressor/biotin-[acetyl-CoA-carboxylase] ligase
MTRNPRLPPAYRLVMLEAVDSTNTVARRLAVEEAAADGTLVVAARQEAGRGRRGNPWESPPGNLYSSMVLRPDCTIAEATQLSFVAALAVYDMIGSVGPPGLEAWCKWPNDVYIGGGKVAGILLECEGTAGVPDFVILGIGVNIDSHPQDTAYAATSLKAEGCGSLEVADVLESLARHFMVWANRWRDDGFAPIRAAWLGRAKGRGEAITVRLGAETLEGTFNDLDQDGALIVGADGGDRRVTAGEVFLGSA